MDALTPKRYLYSVLNPAGALIFVSSTDMFNMFRTIVRVTRPCSHYVPVPGTYSNSPGTEKDIVPEDSEVPKEQLFLF